MGNSLWAGPADSSCANWDLKHDFRQLVWVFADSRFGILPSLGPIPARQVKSSAGSKVGKQNEWLPPAARLQGREDGCSACDISLISGQSRHLHGPRDRQHGGTSARPWATDGAPEARLFLIYELSV